MTITKLLLTTTAICGFSFIGTAGAVEVGTWDDFKNAIVSGTDNDIILTDNIYMDFDEKLTLNRNITIKSQGITSLRLRLWME